MTNTNTLEKPKKKTGGFASRLLGKQLEERTKKSTFDFAKPALQSSSKENGEILYKPCTVLELISVLRRCKYQNSLVS